MIDADWTWFVSPERPHVATAGLTDAELARLLRDGRALLGFADKQGMYDPNLADPSLRALEVEQRSRAWRRYQSEDNDSSKLAAGLLSLLCGVLAVCERGDHVAALILLSAGFAIWATWVGTETA